MRWIGAAELHQEELGGEGREAKPNTRWLLRDRCGQSSIRGIMPCHGLLCRYPRPCSQRCSVLGSFFAFLPCDRMPSTLNRCCAQAAGLGKGIAMTNQSLYQVETGRRDGFVSRASEAEAHLPSSYANISALKANFGSKRLTARDLAVLSGIVLQSDPLHART